MTDKTDNALLRGDWSELLERIRRCTPARVLVGRAGAAYRTGTQLELRQAHAAARDAVRDELDVGAQLGAELMEGWGLFEVCTQANSKDEYLLEPALGRRFSETSRAELMRRSTLQNDVQIAIGDGLSVSAVAAQVPKLLPALGEGAKARGWTVGQVFVIRHCRVGILNEIGELLAPAVAVLLIGERPGLVTAESLSAYMAYRPQHAHTDADRNLISNIHERGIRPADAAIRILDLAERMMNARISGTQLQAKLPATAD